MTIRSEDAGLRSAKSALLLIFESVNRGKNPGIIFTLSFDGQTSIFLSATYSDKEQDDAGQRLS